MANLAKRTDWAEEDDEDSVALPAPQVVKNKDGTESTISYHIRDDGKKVKTTRRIKRTIVRSVVNPHVAERRAWAKFGMEAGKGTGPQSDTTSVGENIVLRMVQGFKPGAQDVKKAEEEKKNNTLKDAKIKCRICSGDHWTTKCPWKDTMAPEGEPGSTAGADESEAVGAEGRLGAGSGGYVPPHLRKGGAASGERMGGKYERDDLATLRVTNVSELAEEQDLRDLFSRWGHVTRVFLAKDRETGRAKGFAFVSYADRSDAARACEKMDGFGFHHLILRVEFAKKST